MFWFFRKHLQNIDPFFELKQKSFYTSTKAADTLLAQLNIDIDQAADLINDKSTIEQQFYNYMEVCHSFLKTILKLLVILRYLFGAIYVTYHYQLVMIVLKRWIHFIK